MACRNNMARIASTFLPMAVALGITGKTHAAFGREMWLGPALDGIRDVVHS